MFKRPDTRGLRQKRHRRIRRTLSGTTQRPRLAVFRSLEHIYGQIIDDTAGSTLVAASDLEASLRDGDPGSKSDRAKQVGQLLAEREPIYRQMADAELEVTYLNPDEAMVYIVRLT